MKDLLNLFRRREPSFEKISREQVRDLFLALVGMRRSLVEAFEELKDRRLRDLYDVFSFMMLHFDKLYQFLRRWCGMPLYIGPNEVAGTCLEKGVDACIDSLPLELAIVVRRLWIQVLMLRKVASQDAPSSIRSCIVELDRIVENLASKLMSALS